MHVRYHFEVWSPQKNVCHHLTLRWYNVQAKKKGGTMLFIIIGEQWIVMGGRTHMFISRRCNTKSQQHISYTCGEMKCL